MVSSIGSLRIGFGHIDDPRILAVPVPPVLKDQRNAGHSNAHEYDNEDAANVLDRDAIRLILRLIALGQSFVVLPPLLLELLQLSFVEQGQDSKASQGYEEAYTNIFPLLTHY